MKVLVAPSFLTSGEGKWQDRSLLWLCRELLPLFLLWLGNFIAPLPLLFLPMLCCFSLLGHKELLLIAGKVRPRLVD